MEMQMHYQGAPFHLTSGESENCDSRWNIAALESVEISSRQDEDKEMREMKDFLSDEILPEDVSQREKVKKFAPQYILEGDVLYHAWKGLAMVAEFQSILGTPSNTNLVLMSQLMI